MCRDRTLCFQAISRQEDESGYDSQMNLQHILHASAEFVVMPRLQYQASQCPAFPYGSSAGKFNCLARAHYETVYASSCYACIQDTIKATSTTTHGSGKEEHTIRIGTGLIEYAPQCFLSTTTYNGGFPGPLVRFTEGRLSPSTMTRIH